MTEANKSLEDLDRMGHQAAAAAHAANAHQEVPGTSPIPAATYRLFGLPLLIGFRIVLFMATLIATSTMGASIGAAIAAAAGVLIVFETGYFALRMRRLINTDLEAARLNRELQALKAEEAELRQRAEMDVPDAGDPDDASPRKED